MAVALTGCGPTVEQITGTGLMGASLYVVLAWLLLLGVLRVEDRLRGAPWREADTRGLWVLVGIFLPVSVVALRFAPSTSQDEAAMIWSCAAANVLSFSLLVHLVRRGRPSTSVLLGASLALLPAVGGAFGVQALGVVAIYLWFWGGFMGAVPFAIMLLIWGWAWVKRDRFQSR